MNAFDLLHPAVQHHIVNSLGGTSLRPQQKRAVEPLLRGNHALLLAPTAGGKTEAALRDKTEIANGAGKGPKKRRQRRSDEDALPLDDHVRAGWQLITTA